MALNSVQEYFDTLSDRFVAEAAKGFDAVFHWQLSGDDGGEFHAKVKDGALEVAQGPHDDPTVSLMVSAENYLKIINGQMNGTMAVMTRKMKVNGNIMMAKKMQQIFPLK